MRHFTPGNKPKTVASHRGGRVLLAVALRKFMALCYSVRSPLFLTLVFDTAVKAISITNLDARGLGGETSALAGNKT